MNLLDIINSKKQCPFCNGQLFTNDFNITNNKLYKKVVDGKTNKLYSIELNTNRISCFETEIPVQNQLIYRRSSYYNQKDIILTFYCKRKINLYNNKIKSQMEHNEYEYSVLVFFDLDKYSITEIKNDTEQFMILDSNIKYQLTINHRNEFCQILFQEGKNEIKKKEFNYGILNLKNNSKQYLLNKIKTILLLG